MSANLLRVSKRIIKTIFPLIVGIVVLWLLYRKTDIAELWEITKTANFYIIGYSLLFGLGGNIFRALRWELTIQSVGYYPKRISLIYAVMGNYAVNFVLPRAGEVWRCGVITKYDKVPFSTTFGTLLVDRFFDVVAMGFILVLCFTLEFNFFISLFKENPTVGSGIVSMVSSFWFYATIILVFAFLYVVFNFLPNFFLIKKVKLFYQGIKRDILTVWKMKQKGLFILYTFLCWLGYYLYFYLCFYAFDFTEHLGPVAGLIVFAMSSLGVAAPTQGGIGAWHFMVIYSLVIYGVAKDQAAAFAGAVFTIQSAWLILIGIFSIFAIQYVKRDLPNSAEIKVSKPND
ncbi:MAG: lysylphosphatidylglycerol synthase transmembrane domain-containing protein [Dysgonamonadaceae bacterium]|nr:lysylphosphatidylglycerol synthase transmembrane domain-containing protein [Dysgonamonadaceae bacterium]MDD4727920.1 lysylphosphatidylglycerol synthase transmembrane domain-containing protein [Dysgonamonadaceae bacterium]